MQRKYKILIISFFLLNLFDFVSVTEFKYGIPQVFKYLLSASVLSTIIWYKFKNPSIPKPGVLFNLFVIIFVVWSAILLFSTILRFDGIFFLQRVLAVPIFFIPYLLPLFLLYSKFDLEFFGNLFYYSFLLLIPALMIQLYFVIFSLSPEIWGEQASTIRLFDLGLTFLLFLSHITKKRNVFYVVLCYNLIWIYMWSVYGRRGMLVESMITLIFMIIIRLKSSLVNISGRIKIYFAIVSVIILLLAFGYLFTSTYAFQRGFDRSSFEDSRGNAFEAFFFDFHSTSDWFFGRGIGGTVLRSFFSEESFTAVENGFLTILLKGGLLYSIPFILILLRASYLGFFRSSNDLAKALASILLIFVIMMAYFNLPIYSTSYIFIWISVSACLTPVIRNYSNEEVRQVIDSRFK